jgi:cell division protein FtsN
MPKDYAKKMISARRHGRQKERSFVPVAAAIIAAFCLISAAVYVVHVWHRSSLFTKEHVAAWVDNAKAMVSHKDKPVVKDLQRQAASPADEVQFDFYTELPNMQVNLPETTELKSASVAAPASIKKPAGKMMQIDESIQTVLAKQSADIIPKKVVQFVLQLGEFHDPVSASQLRLSLLLAGIETEIIKTPEKTYRVQQGPWTSERQAKLAEKVLSKKGFEGSVKAI